MSIVFKRKSDKLNSLNSDSLELWVKRLKLTKINLKDFLQMTLKMILEASVWSRYLLNKYFTKKNFDKMKSRRRQFTSSYKCPLVSVSQFFYLSNKKFAVTKYRVWSNFLFFALKHLVAQCIISFFILEYRL
ncbi:hypothetical protein RhiirC2_534187 [Rhizophagus irregularis]|uniref:Uncharacterized protein n=1 Tax=Rhizophagus irregularis TaxID=588596 RepID=A0A2N1N440_9GLOM|nr:hypothetical protein RhiirC2_534187 [Rhizophagus irregularis]